MAFGKWKSVLLPSPDAFLLASNTDMVYSFSCSGVIFWTWRRDDAMPSLPWVSACHQTSGYMGKRQTLIWSQSFCYMHPNAFLISKLFPSQITVAFAFCSPIISFPILKEKKMYIDSKFYSNTSWNLKFLSFLARMIPTHEGICLAVACWMDVKDRKSLYKCSNGNLFEFSDLAVP